MEITITAAGKAFTATIEGSETGKAFIQRLPMTLEMSELNGNEKYCYGVALPHNDSRYDRIEAGDIMLYSGDCVVLFYGPAGGYNYTRIGKIEDITGLADVLGRGGESPCQHKDPDHHQHVLVAGSFGENGDFLVRGFDAPGYEQGIGRCYNEGGGHRHFVKIARDQGTGQIHGQEDE